MVRDHGSHAPLAGVKIELPDGRSAVTDDKGHFHFDDVEPGKLPVSVSGPSITEVRTTETFEAGKIVSAKYEVEPMTAKAAGEPADDLEIVVQAPPLEKQVVTTQIPAEQARRVPGTQGDVLKVVENMPGVGRPPAGTGQLVVWGAAPNDTRVYIDGVRIPLLYHFGGYRSVLSSDFVQSVELAPGGYGVEYGRGLGGIVTVNTKPIDLSGFHGSAQADFLDASASASAAVTDRFRVAIAARKSYLDALLPLVTSSDVGVLYPIARYADGQARIAYSLSKTETIEADAMLSSDAVDRTVASADPQTEGSQTQTMKWYRLMLRYRRELEGGGVVTIVPSFGADSSSLVSRFGGGAPTALTDDAKVFGLRGTYRARIAGGVTATGGVYIVGSAATLHRAGSISSPPREGDIAVFGQAPSDQVGVDDWNAVVASAAAFAEFDVPFFEGRLHVVPGIRFEPYVITASRRTPVVAATPSIGVFTDSTEIEPRLSASYALSSRAKVKAAWGLYHQAPAPEDLSAVFGNPLLDTSRAHHFLFGGETELTKTLHAEVTTFYTTSSDLAARNPSPTPLLAQALEQVGSGRPYGAQVFIRQELAKGFFGWLSYSISRSERQDTTDGRWRLFDFDQTHVLTAVGSYQLPWKFEAGLRVRVATGFPRTPVTGAYYDARLDVFEPVFGVQNTTRLPTFFQLDARISKRFSFSKTTELEVYLDVQNVTDRANPEEVVYNRDYTQQAYITGLPVLPVLGARLQW